VQGRAKLTIRSALVSMLLLVPCFWQPRIQACDLSSHLYNAWLAQLISRGQAPGLVLVPKSQNVLFDLLLDILMRAWGAAAAEHIAVSLAVLVFFWGAFAFVSSCSRRREAPWQLAPCLAMLAYGWVFRMGLFNFYLSLGLAFWALAAARRNQRWAWAVAVLLSGLAVTAHGLPVVWALGAWVYERVARVLRPRQRPNLMAAALVLLALAGAILAALFTTRRGPDQVTSLTGADQVWIYGKVYIAVAMALFTVWAACFMRVLDARGLQRILWDVRFQLCALSAAWLVLMPGGVLLPLYHTSLDFLPERMSLPVAVLFCGLLASVRLPRPLVGAMAAIAVVFFGLSYRDERALNQIETQMARAVAQLPPGRRVVSALGIPQSRVKSLVHVIDRVCIGRCFSYANYEPGTWQFRVQALRENPIVVLDYRDSWDLQAGQYVVKPRDLPIYKVDRCDAATGGLCVSPLKSGDRVRKGMER